MMTMRTAKAGATDVIAATATATVPTTTTAHDVWRRVGWSAGRNIFARFLRDWS
jgi:hypothetical protein